ncbi:MAG: hypothetical protein LBG44_08150 [Gemmatimonadota bacterium]|nr:hypothetical protein [Gemmatimonadota bacterium]
MRLAGFGLEGARVGISAKPVVAGVAARIGKEPLTIVPSGEEAGFLAPLPLSLLLEEETAEDADLLELLEGAGIGKCGELTKVSPDAIEVRFGVRGTELRNLARGDDRRALFRPIPAERPQASADFVDYTIRDATRIVFILNALLERVCETLRERSRRARSMTLTLTLAGGSRVQKQLRASRPTADRLFWIRQLRATLEKTRTGDAIVGVELEASQDEAISAIQGDLFDRGFVTSAAVEEVMARLTDAHPGLFVRRIESSHPLPEYRALQEEAPVEQETPDLYGPEDAALELRLLTEPRPVRVRTRNRRDHKLPVSFHHESGWRSVVAAGPHRVSCGHEEETPQAREYFRCVSDNGQLLWIYHDAVTEKWFLHGWWD